VQEEIAELIGRICLDARAFEEEHAAVLSALDALASDLEQGEASAQQGPLPPLEQARCCILRPCSSR
jgi:hypothetical protein